MAVHPASLTVCSQATSHQPQTTRPKLHVTRHTRPRDALTFDTISIVRATTRRHVYRKPLIDQLITPTSFGPRMVSDEGQSESVRQVGRLIAGRPSAGFGLVTTRRARDAAPIFHY